MTIQKTIFSGLLIINPQINTDERGFFYESYSKSKFLENNLEYNFIQDNHSFNRKKNTFRGMHFQLPPMAQITLVRVSSGVILDIVIDIRKGSPTYGMSFSVELSSCNNKQLLIPVGFAHGFLTLTDNTSVLYKMDKEYSPEYDRIINHIEIDINQNIDFKTLIIAKKDKLAPSIDRVENTFIYGINC